jgi:hypothetical protein
MKLIVKYFFMTLVIFQALFIFAWYTNTNFLGILSWIKNDTMKLFAPLLVYGAIKICYWVADPVSKLYNILLKWFVIFAIFYLLYWVFFV